MARRTAPATGARKNNRRWTLIWIAVSAAIIVGLIWKEQVELLYLLATLSMTVLLVIVGMADLGDARQPVTEPSPNDDAAAVGDGLGASAANAARAAKRR